MSISKFINNSHETFNKYKLIIDGCQNPTDITEILIKNGVCDRDINLLLSYASSRKYNICFSKSNFIEIINSLNKLKYKEEVLEEINKYILKTTDIAQLNTMQRIASIKPFKPISNVKVLKEDTIKKACPHCHQLNVKEKTASYVICGYDVDGYNWEGCGKDWCFECGKKLCKSWDSHNLFLEDNRKHNKKCCKDYAEHHNLNYEEEFCFCKNNHVDRENEKDNTFIIFK
jgi:hypothetical protein